MLSSNRFPKQKTIYSLSSLTTARRSRAKCFLTLIAYKRQYRKNPTNQNCNPQIFMVFSPLFIIHIVQFRHLFQHIEKGRESNCDRDQNEQHRVGCHSRTSSLSTARRTPSARLMPSRSQKRSRIASVFYEKRTAICTRLGASVGLPIFFNGSLPLHTIIVANRYAKVKAYFAPPVPSDKTPSAAVLLEHPVKFSWLDALLPKQKARPTASGRRRGRPADRRASTESASATIPRGRPSSREA